MDTKLPYQLQQTLKCNLRRNLQQQFPSDFWCLSRYPILCLLPLLLLCFENDIPAPVQCKIRLYLYADDILLYSEISSINDCICLQNNINYVFNWSETWLLQFNPAKCMHLQISNKRSDIKFTYYLHRSIIKEVPSANYLGITINSDLTWSDHDTTVVAKANSILGFLQRNLKYCPSEIKASCFKSLVIPILEQLWVQFMVPHFQKDTYLWHKNDSTEGSEVYF